MAAWIWLAGAAVYLVCEAVAATRVTGYSYVGDFISDLGAVAVMNVGFMVYGSLFLLGAVVIARTCRPLGCLGWSFVVAAAANAVGNVVVGAIQSGNHWHVIGAGLAIVGGNVAVVLGGLVSRRTGAPRLYRVVSVAIGIFGLICLLTLVVDGANNSRALPVGVVERGSVYTIVLWEILTAAALLLRIRRVSRR